MDAYDADDPPVVKLTVLTKALQSVARGLKDGKKLNKDILTLAEARIEEVLRILVGLQSPPSNTPWQRGRSDIEDA